MKPRVIAENFGRKVLGVSKGDAKYLGLRSIYHTLKARWEWLQWAQPRFVTIELTTRCNSLCRYCGRTHMVKAGELEVADAEYDVLRLIVSNLRRYCPNLESLVIAGLGEPLLYRKLFTLIALLRSELPNTELSLLTNGIALTESNGRKVIESQVDRLCISMNTFDRETYRMENGVDKFDVVFKNTIRFLKMKGAKKPYTKIQLLNIDANRPHFQEFIDFWSPRISKVDRYFIKGFENAGGRITHRNFDSTFKLRGRHPCLQLWTNLGIDKEANVYPCCIAQIGGTQLLIGSLREKSLGAILQSESMMRLRRLHREHRYKEIPVCETCDLWSKTRNPFIFLGKWR